MKRVLITGMSGTGKSAAVRELAARGFRAVDLDTPEWSEWVSAAPSDDLTPADGKDWVWREDRVRELLSRPIEGPLFVSGCAENMDRLLPLVDLVILLRAPTATIMRRLEARGTGGFGHTKVQREKVAQLIAIVEPLLREVADHEIATDRPIAATIDEVLQLCDDLDESATVST